MARTRRAVTVNGSDEQCTYGISLLISICKQQRTQTWRSLEQSRALFIKQEAEWFDTVQRMYDLDDKLPSEEALFTEMGRSYRITPRINHYLSKVVERRASNQIRPILKELEDAVKHNRVDDIRLLFATGNSTLADTYVTNAPSTEGIRTVLGHGMSQLHRQLNGQFLSLQQDNAGTVTTGWPAIDEAIAGGYKRGTMTIWAARPNVGKTFLLLWQAWQAILTNRRCMFVTVEMTREEIFDRFLALAGNLDPKKIGTRQMSSPAREKAMQVIEDYQHSTALNVFANDGRVTTRDIENEVKAYEPDIIYLDGLYLLQPGDMRSFKDRFTKVASIMDDLRELTKRTNIPLVATTQFNRYAGKGGAEGSLENIGYSDTIATHSDVVFGVKTLKEFATAGKLKLEEGLVRNAANYRVLSLVKNRRGINEVDFFTGYGFAPTDFSYKDAIKVRLKTGDRSSNGDIMHFRQDEGWEGGAPAGPDP